jgi:hypothetical protein
MEPWAAAKQNFELVWRCHQLQSGIDMSHDSEGIIRAL